MQAAQKPQRRRVVELAAHIPAGEGLGQGGEGPAVGNVGRDGPRHGAGERRAHLVADAGLQLQRLDHRSESDWVMRQG